MKGQVRLVTLNFWGLEPPLDRRMQLAIDQLGQLDADVVCLQEVRPLGGNDGPTTADEMADALGMKALYHQAVAWPEGGRGPGSTAGQEGLAILTRYQVVDWRVTGLPEARPADARILLSARIETPAGMLWAHTTHLHYRLDDGVAREKQVVVIDQTIRDLGRDPGDPPQLLCGDFNAPPDADEMRFLRGMTTLAGRRTHFQDAWLRVHPDSPGHTWSSENEQTRPLRSLDIDRRIDYILVTTRNKDGRGTVRDARVVLDERDADGTAASDHYGVLADVQIAADRQS